MGALMISMDCNHPDIEDFIEIKNDLDKVTNANISIRFTDDFMNAVVNDEEVELSFTRPETDETIKKTIKAREVFKKLSDSNWDMGEPGCLFWDRVCNYNLLSNTKEFSYAGTNPCAEEPLPAGGSCLLGSINLSEFVKNPFTNRAEFDYEDFMDTVYDAVVGLNEVLDEGLPLHPLKEQQESVRDWRQIGLGIMGISEMLIKLGIRYGSMESIKLCDIIGATMACVATEASADLAKNFGAFPKCNMSEIISTDFFKKHFKSNYGMEYGLRNSQLLTIAPTGTLSTMLGISGGIEPIFAKSYTRTTKSLHGKDVTYKVYTPIIKKYMELNNIVNEEDLPDIFVTAQNLNYKERIAMQAVWQSHIDASISSTINLPNSATKEDVFNIYIEAWRAGLKGVTIFRDGCARTAILNTKDNKEEKQEEHNHTPTKLTIPRGTIMHVPEDLMYRKYKLITGCGKLYFFVGYDDNGVIYDCFTNTDGTGGCTINTQAVSRLLSACIRGGVPVEYIIEQLQKSGTCPSFQYARGKGKKLSKGSSCPSAIGYVLKDILAGFAEDAIEEEEINDVEIKTESQPKTTIKSDNKQMCPDCGGELVYEGGCVVCPSCGWSRCG